MKFQTISLLNSFCAAKGANCYVAIATEIFSHVKIQMYHVFEGKLTWYFSGVYIVTRWFSMIMIRIITVKTCYNKENLSISFRSDSVFLT